MLSNHHSPLLLSEEEGIRRRKKNKDGGRDWTRSSVPILFQTKAYVTQFNKIDKRNLKDSYHDLNIVSKKHTWAPKQIMPFFNMNSGSTGIFYERLRQLYTMERHTLYQKERIADLNHSFYQRGPTMQTHEF